MLLLEPLKLAPLESLLPNGTSQLGPPVIAVESLAAKAMMSAQDTV
uniref:Peroxidase 72 n=1 Tax=Rhizophora mucronata TaxID=61149 RepID=A0A2P2PBU1_RHIMU